MKTDRTPARTNTHHSMETRYSKLCSHLSMAHHASCDAMINEIITSLKKSLESKVVMLCTEAPSTRRTPISLMRFCAIYAARPNKPRQEMNMVRPAKSADNFH